MKPELIDFYMDVAIGASKLSKGIRRKVGAIAVKDANIIGYAYNGDEPGGLNILEDVIDEITIEEFIHKFYDDGRVVDDGKNYYYNEKTRTYQKLKTKSNVSHAEENLITYKLANSTISSNGAILFCTTLPCMTCARLIANAGFVKVYYIDEYSDLSSIEYFKNRKIEVIKYVPKI